MVIVPKRFGEYSQNSDDILASGHFQKEGAGVITLHAHTKHCKIY